MNLPNSRPQAAANGEARDAEDLTPMHGETVCPDNGAASDRCEDFAETMRGWMWETDTEDRFIYLSQSVTRITGVPVDWHLGKTRADLGGADTLIKDQWQLYLSKIRDRQPFFNFVFRRHGPDGDRWMRTSGKPVFDHSGQFVGYRGTAADITAEIEAEGRVTRLNGTVQEKNNILATALRTIPDGVQILDKDLKLIAWNDQLFSILELDQDSILAAADPARAMRLALAERGEFGEGDPVELVAAREEIERQADTLTYEREITTGKWIECRWRPVPGGSVMAIYRDITETRTMMQQLEQQASVDVLTGVSNRRKFMETAQDEFNRSSRYDRPLSFVLFDIDNFKVVNDTHGHAFGDQVLRMVATTCARHLRDCDRLARYGGEEFIALLPETDLEGAEIVAERLRVAVEHAARKLADSSITVTISAGVSEARAAHKSPQDVIDDADQALYRAKNAGRNCVRTQ